MFSRTGNDGGGVSGATNHGVGIATGATSMTSTAALTDGQILVPEREELPKLTVRLPDDSLVVRSLVPRPQGRVKVMA